jgi:hypothetical protein
MHPTNQLEVLSVDAKLATPSPDCCIGPLKASSLESSASHRHSWVPQSEKSRWLGALKVSKSISWRRWRCLGLSILHVEHGLLHGLKHLSLHHQNLLEGQGRVGSIIVLSIVLGVDVAVPCVDHLKN